MLKRRSIEDLIKRVHDHATMFCEDVEKMPTNAEIRDNLSSRKFVTIKAKKPKNGWDRRGVISTISGQKQLDAIVYVIPSDFEEPVYKTAGEFNTAFHGIKNSLFRFIQITNSSFTTRMLSGNANNDYEILNPMAFYHDILKMARTPASAKVISVSEYYGSNPYDVSSLNKIDPSDPVLVWLDARIGDIVIITTMQSNSGVATPYYVSSVHETKLSSRDYAKLDMGGSDEADATDADDADDE